MITKNEYFKTLCNINRAFGSTNDKDILLDMVVHGAIDTMGGKAACLFLDDEKNNLFIPAAQTGLSDNYIHSDCGKCKTEVEGILDGGFLVFYDVATDLRLENRDIKVAEGIASILVVPVMVKDKAIGVLSLYTSEHRNFSKDEVRFLSALAEQGGMAIQTSRLVSRIKSNSLLFYDLASNLNSSLNLRGILDVMSVDICKALGMKGATIRALEKEKDALNLVAHYGLGDEFINYIDEKADLVESEAIKDQTVIIKNVFDDNRIINKDLMKGQGIVSMLCIPVKAKETLIGVMNLYFGVAREFPDDIINLISALAHQGGLAIQNLSMYRMLEKELSDIKNEMIIDRSMF